MEGNLPVGGDSTFNDVGRNMNVIAPSDFEMDLKCEVRLGSQQRNEAGYAMTERSKQGNLCDCILNG
jgi:hypothetical protein